MASLRRNPIAKAFSGLILRAFFTFHPEGKAAREPDERLGLLEDSIIGNPLYYPFDEQSVIQGTMSAGEWMGYDFHRPYRLPVRRDGRALRQRQEGKIIAFMLSDLKGRPGHVPTSSTFFKPHVVDHALSFDAPGIEVLVAEEYVVPTTHIAAYRRAGVYERFAVELDAKGIGEEPVYQVTPKGNSLIHIGSTGGKPKLNPFLSPQLLPKPVTG